MSSMRSPVHPKYKAKYRITNWPEYDRSLVQRGDVMFLVSLKALTVLCVIVTTCDTGIHDRSQQGSNLRPGLVGFDAGDGERNPPLRVGNADVGSSAAYPARLSGSRHEKFRMLALVARSCAKVMQWQR